MTETPEVAAVKLSELLKKFRRRSPHEEEGERSADGVDEAATVAEAEGFSTWIPSQQDERPRH